MDRTAPGLLRRSLDVASELGERTRAGAGQLAERAAAAGLPVPEDALRVVDELAERQRRSAEVVTTMVRAEVLRVVRSAGLAGEDDVDQLRAELEGLRRTVRTLGDRVAELEAREATR